MSYAQRQTVVATTAADGSVTAYTDRIQHGRIHSITYTKAAASEYADTVDFAITVEGTGEGVWTEANVTATKTVAPRLATHDLTGTASVYAAAGEPVEGDIVIVDDRVKIAITNGGDTKVGTFNVVFS